MTGECIRVDLVKQLRSVLSLVDPALLTHADRCALLGLAHSSYEARIAGGGGLRFPCSPDDGLVAGVAPLQLADQLSV